VENQVFPEESLTYRKFIDELLARGISAVTFSRGMTAAEGAVLIELLSDARIDNIEDARTFLESRDVTGVSVAETTTLDEATNEARNKEVRARARESYDTGVTAMRDIESQAKLGRAMNVSALQRVVESMLDNLLQDPAAVLGLTSRRRNCTHWDSLRCSTTSAKSASPRMSCSRRDPLPPRSGRRSSATPRRAPTCSSVSSSQTRWR
jgi:hypothetical protein